MNKLNKFKNSITFRYLSIATVFLLVAQLLFGLIGISINFQQQQSTLQSKVSDIASFLSAVSPESILFNDFRTLEILVQQASKDPDIVYTLVVDNEGRLLTRFLNREDALIVSALASNPALNMSEALTAVRGFSVMRELQRDIIIDDEKLGTILLGYSVAGVQQQFFTSALSITLAAILASLLLSALTIVLFQWQIKNPIQVLAKLAHALAAGDLTQRAQVKGADEIDSLAASFNQMATEIEQYRNHLEELVEQRTLELSQTLTDLKVTQEQLTTAKERAEMANQAKSEFLSNMSHELRTPLNGVLGYTQILRRNSSLSSSDQRKIEIIYQSGSHLLTLINDILDLAKIESRKIELEESDIHLDTFLKNIVEMVSTRAEEKRLQLVYEADKELAIGIRGDEKRLRQALINMLFNGVKFTQKGQVMLKVSQLEDQGTSHLLRFEVRDTGVGISPEQLKQILLPFEQVGDLNHRAQGTGLGLAITNRLLALMGSKICVQSQLGQGSRFWFDLTVPVVVTYQPTERVKERVIGYKGQARQIMVVDDQEANRALLSDMLVPLGFEVIEAENGYEGLYKAKQGQPDLILIDLVMPVMGGIEAVQKIRQIPHLSQTPIIAISAKAFEQDQKESIRAGCDAFLPKPIDEERLQEFMGNYLDLEWVYDAIENDQKVEEQRTEALQSHVSLIAPPVEELNIIHELTSEGRMSALRKRLDYIEQLDPTYAPFIEQVRQLSRGFEDDEIMALVEQYLNQ